MFAAGAKVRRCGLAVALVLALAPAAARAEDLQLVATKQLDPRLVELTLRTPALAAETHLRVLLPAGYDPSAARRYPVLYLLHGGADDYRSWTRPQDDKGDAEKATAGLPLIVVMPDAGQGGWYTDWYNNGAGGTPKWETYHVGQLIPFVDAHYRTIPERRGRAIAGLSMGGFGAMSYAARHPDLFAAASTWSGAVDTNDPPEVAGHVIDAIAGLDGGQPGSLWGLRETQEVRWRGHNPWDLAANLRGMTLAIHTGDGRTGGPYGGGGDPLEPAVHEMSVSFHGRLSALGIPHVWDDYGPGGHDWPYWNRDLREDLPGMMATFERAGRSPARFSYTAIEPTYDIYGWHVALDRPVLEFSTLDGGVDAFTLRGSGSATVTTPGRFRPGAAYDAGDRGIVADAEGRLHIPVDLGPASGAQEYTAPGSTAGTNVVIKTVSIRRSASCASRRAETVTLTGVRAATVRRVTVLVNGRRRAVLRGPRRRARVSMVGMPRGAVRIELRVQRRSGAAVVVRRLFHLCAPRR